MVRFSIQLDIGLSYTKHLARCFSCFPTLLLNRTTKSSAGLTTSGTLEAEALNRRKQTSTLSLHGGQDKPVDINIRCILYFVLKKRCHTPATWMLDHYVGAKAQTEEQSNQGLRCTAGRPSEGASSKSQDDCQRLPKDQRRWVSKEVSKEDMSKMLQAGHI